MESITINTIKHTRQKKNVFKAVFEIEKVKINPNDTIQSFVKGALQNVGDEIDISRTKIVECGRILKMDQTFEDQRIQS